MRRHSLAVAVILALFGTAFLGPMIKPFLMSTPLMNFRGGVSIASYAIDLALLIGCVLLLGGRNRPTLGVLSGLVAPIGKPLLFGLLLFAPAVAIAAYYAPVATNFDGFELATGGFLYPLFEEIGFRGLALGALMTLCGWRFLPAALLPAAAFGAAHFWQGQTPGEVAGVVAITAIGGLFFGWLYVRWNRNLWPAVIVHSGLNALWTVFALGETAIGGWFGNALRVGVITAAVVLTLVMTRGFAQAEANRA